MKKDRFLGYLDAIYDMAEACQFNEDQIPELIADIRKKAEQLELVEHTIPYTPPTQPWWDPYKPYVTWTSDSISWNPKDNPINFELDITDSISYNCKIPEPNEWSVKKSVKIPNNWEIIK